MCWLNAVIEILVCLSVNIAFVLGAGWGELGKATFATDLFECTQGSCKANQMDLTL